MWTLQDLYFKFGIRLNFFDALLPIKLQGATTGGGDIDQTIISGYKSIAIHQNYTIVFIGMFEPYNKYQLRNSIYEH